IAYLAAVSWSAPAVGLYQSLRCHCEGASRTRPVMLLACVAFLINIPLDYLFVFGGLGIPALGGEGCGWATSLVCWITLTLAWWYVRHQGARQRLPMLHSQWVAPQLPKLRYLLTLGIPVGLAIFFEVSLFSLVSIMVSRYGTETLAGHQVAYSVTSSIYMIPLAIGMAISVRTGFLLGAGEPRHARFAAFCGIALAGLSALATGALLLLLRTPIASLYSDNETVLTLAAHLMVLAVLFQVPDALQVSLSGALRAYRDTRAIMLATALAYWVIGLPLGMALAEGVGGLPPLGVTGYWSGLIAGLSAAAVLLALRLRRTARRHATSRPP
ncbi:MAG: MATE family efflux transporter, partial [Gammaproteobacteria bacterium]|nr:MATE family efflux transporter [Gammaproteobacteria bacterium]